MKEYKKPEIIEEDIQLEDIIAVSANDDDSDAPQKAINLIFGGK